MNLEPEEPRWPEKHKCESCGANVYRVTSQDGEDIVLDVGSIETAVESTLGKPRVCRATYRHHLLRRAGGHRLLEPELFWSLDEDSGCGQAPQWQWFSVRASLEAAAFNGMRLHAEHIETCSAVNALTLRAKLTNVAVMGDAAGDRVAKRRLNLRRPSEIVEHTADAQSFYEETLDQLEFAYE